MSIGSWRALLKLSAKPLVNSVYLLTGPQVQQSVARSVYVVAVLASLAIINLSSFSVNAGDILGKYSHARADDFFDWEYAKKVWFEFNTWEKEEKEWDKYKDDFNPWMEIYKKNANNAMEVLKTYDKNKSDNIKRAYDIQLAYENWFTNVYIAWYNGYAYEVSMSSISKRKAATFDDLLAVNSRPCVPRNILTECGPRPDWRSPKWKAKEQAMMAKANADAAKAEAERNKGK